MKIQALQQTLKSHVTFKSNLDKNNIPHIPNVSCKIEKSDTFEPSVPKKSKKPSILDRIKETLKNNSMSETKNTQKSIWTPSYDLTEEITSAFKDYKASKPELGIQGRVDANVLRKAKLKNVDNITLQGAFSTPMLDRYMSIDKVMVLDPKEAQGPFGNIAKRLDGPFIARDVELFKKEGKAKIGSLTSLNYDREGNFKGVTVYKNVLVKDTLENSALDEEDREFSISADEMLKFDLDEKEYSKDLLYAQGYEISTSAKELKALGLNPEGNFALEDNNSRIFSDYLLVFLNNNTKDVIGYNRYASKNGDDNKASCMASKIFSL